MFNMKNKKALKTPAKRKSILASKKGKNTKKPYQTSNLSSYRIVGIGASSGGLETFTHILKHLPNDTGLAFIFVQHLDPTHESLAPDIISRATKMPVHEVVNDQHPLPNNVYLIPPNFKMEIQQGNLKLSPRKDLKNQHLSIDSFFKSLAIDQKSNAIGIVLSGTGSDGTLGLKHIKAEGGLTIVQDPKTAKFDGMPSNAVSFGVADLILSPEKIAQELTFVSKLPNLSNRMVQEPPLLTLDNNYQLEKKKTRISNTQIEVSLRKIFSLLKNHKQVDFSEYKPSTIMRRIQRRMTIVKAQSVHDYAIYLQEYQNEINELFADILINVTEFFRDEESFEALGSQVLPLIIKSKQGGTPIRIWVAGCSTGEEVYSLAILFIEFLNHHDLDIPLQIFGTDISDSALKKARAGFYSEDLTHRIGSERLRKFFDPIDGGYKIKKSIRDLCLFSRHDIANDPPFSKLDLISCRNVLIYFSHSMQKRILPTFHYALNPNGILWLGSSESPGENSKLFLPKDKNHRIYIKSNIASPLYLRPLFNTYTSDPLVQNKKPIEVYGATPDYQKEADKIALLKYAPPYVITNFNLEIQQFRGRTAPFLEPAPGAPNNNLLKMVRQELLSDLSHTIQTAKVKNSAVRSKELNVELDGKRKTLRIEVIPINPLLPSDQQNFVIFFEDIHQNKNLARIIKEEKGDKSKGKLSSKNNKTDNSLTEKIKQLEQELISNKHFHQSLSEEFSATQEELTSSNEELQSTNEELQSSNEELETTKEELQSSNEELVTVNNELQIRNSELITLSSDLSNLLNSVEIPILIVDNNHRIRRFTPRCEKAFNIIPTDIGRPIGDIKSSFDLEIDSILSDVIQTLTIFEKEIKDKNGRWMRLQIKPYRTIDNRIEGAVISLVDIDSLKQELNESIRAQENLAAISDAINLPLVVLNDQFLIESANNAFYSKFNISQMCVGKEIFDSLNLTNENRESLRLLLINTLNTDLTDANLDATLNATTDTSLIDKKSLFKTQLDCNLPLIGTLKLFISTNLIHWNQIKKNSILLSLEDITDRTKSEEKLQLAAKVFSSNLNGIVITDAKNNIIEINPAFTKITGYEKKDVIGKNPRILASGKHTKDFYAQMWNELNQSDYWAGEIFNRKKNGEIYPETLTISAVKDDSNSQIKYYIATFSDISILKNFQNSLIESTKLAEDANLAKSRFLAAMSHEIRTPLNGIIGMAQLLVTPDINEAERMECAQIILKSGNTLLTLLNDVLDISKIEAGKISFETILFDPELITIEIKNLFSEIATSKSLKLESQWNGPSNQLYIGDPHRIRQMISNLVNNAIKFTPSGEIYIEAKEYERKDDKATLEFSVLDTGIGISPENLTHIFKPFSQEDCTITRKYGGTGLGLSIVANLASAMGGEVGVDSLPQKGSRFWFRVEVELNNKDVDLITLPKVIIPETILSSAPALVIKKALVIDDDPTNQLVISKMLNRFGIQIKIAENGKLGLDLIKSGEKFDIILMDLQMPLMDGFTATKQIRKWESDNKKDRNLIIAFTADAYAESKNQCLEIGMNDVLTKPVSFDSIKKIIAKYSQ